MRVKTIAINLQNDLVLTDKKGSLLPRKLYMYLGLEIPHDNIKILQQLGISEYMVYFMMLKYIYNLMSNLEY